MIQEPFDKAPTGVGPALLTIVSALIPLAVNITMSSRFNYQAMLSREFALTSFPKKIWISYLTGFVHRCTFYVGWKLSEAAGIWTGLGYAGVDDYGINRWNRLQNVNIRQIEFAGNLRLLLAGWNANTVRDCDDF